MSDGGSEPSLPSEVGGRSTTWGVVYRWLLRFTPTSTQREHQSEISQTFEDLYGAAATSGRRRRVILRAFATLPKFLAQEWLDAALEKMGPHYGTQSTHGRWEGTVRQFRYAIRSLVRSPAFSSSTIILIALGIGAVTTVFTVVDHVLLRPLPYPNEARLVYMTNGSHSGPIMTRMGEIQGLESWTAVMDEDANLMSPSGQPIRIRQAHVTPSFFPMFGAEPLMGRVIADEDQQDQAVAVATYSAWQTVWGGDPKLVGSTIQIDGGGVRIVGILREGWTPPSPLVGRTVHLLAPVNWADPSLENPQVHRHEIAGLMRPDVGLDGVNEEIGVMAHRVREAFPDLNLFDAEVENPTPLQLLRERTVERAQDGLVFLFGAVGLLLLVACANVAHLFLARGIARQREMAVRRALGASVPTLTGQLAAEALLVGLAGGVAGLLLTWVALTVFQPWMADALPRGTGISLDFRVFLFASVLSAGAAVVFGLLPTVRSIGHNVNNELRGSGTGITGTRKVRLLRSGLVVAEVALSLILVATSGLMLRSFLSVTAVEPGVRIANTWVIPVDFPEDPAPGEYPRQMEELRQAVQSVPGVIQASYGMEAPFQWVGGSRCCWSTSTEVPGDSEETVRTSIHTTDAEFFQTYGIDLVAGRGWSPADVDQVPPPGVLSESMAVRLYGSAAAAVGQTIDMAGDRQARIVGVAESTRHYGLDRDPDDALYLPIEVLPFPIDIGTLGIHVQEGAGDLAGSLRSAIWSVQPELPLPTVLPLEQWVDESSATRRFRAMLLVFFGALALTLAAGGLYGTLLHGVNQRRRELGIRMALGAKSEQIQGLIVGQGVRLAALGALLGLGVTWYLRAVLEQWIYGIPSFDPVSVALAVGALMGTATLASWVPAFRAGRTDPRATLNAE